MTVEDQDLRLACLAHAIHAFGGAADLPVDITHIVGMADRFHMWVVNGLPPKPE
jgi:hypothetical protein